MSCQTNGETPWSTNAAASSGSLRAVRAGSPAHGDPARRIWIEGASTWRNPDEELPAGFDANRGVHYRELSEPRDPAAFIADLQQRHLAALEALNQALARDETGGVRITRRKGEDWASRPGSGVELEVAAEAGPLAGHLPSPAARSGGR